MQKDIIHNLPVHTQSLYSNGSLYWSGNKNMQSSERKALLLSDIKTIVDHMNILKKSLNLEE